MSDTVLMTKNQLSLINISFDYALQLGIEIFVLFLSRSCGEREIVG